MAGHSKWANVKRKKAKVDAERGKIFTKLAREIMVAAREGGGDIQNNFRLRLAVQKAKEANMPNENINRAIQKGTGEQDGTNYESFSYEGYGPEGVALLLDIVTDNRNRTAGEIRSIFSRRGGNLGESGCVSWMFEKKGYIVIEKKAGLPEEDDLMMLALEAGAEDFQSEKDSYHIYTSVDEFEATKKYLEDKNIKLALAEITMVPTTTVNIKSVETAEKLMALIETLEEHDDVQNVYTNFEIDDSIMQQLRS
ncbi:MAG: YebC/PmpR family DNA-binding transcriptional regulator [Firmicutes bacterium]|nr:YebC/PmpR family DNA-binding transcriptional regulator [Bacillota bacterium]